MIIRGILAAAVSMAMLAGDVVVVTAAALCGGDPAAARSACTCAPDHCPSGTDTGLTSRCCDVKAPAPAAPSSQARLKTSDDPAPAVDTASGVLEVLPVPSPEARTADRDGRIQHPPRYRLFCSYLI